MVTSNLTFIREYLQVFHHVRHEGIFTSVYLNTVPPLFQVSSAKKLKLPRGAFDSAIPIAGGFEPPISLFSRQRKEKRAVHGPKRKERCEVPCLLSDGTVQHEKTTRT